jgi:hypothetical protein
MARVAAGFKTTFVLLLLKHFVAFGRFLKAQPMADKKRGIELAIHDIGRSFGMYFWPLFTDNPSP